MFGIGPMELALFLVIVLLVVGPEKLPAFMRTVGKALRQVRNASREFKDAVGFDEFMRDADPFRAPSIRPPQARPVPLENQAQQPEAPQTVPGPDPEAAKAANPVPSVSGVDEPASEADEPEAGADADAAAKAKQS